MAEEVAEEELVMSPVQSEWAAVALVVELEVSDSFQLIPFQVHCIVSAELVELEELEEIRRAVHLVLLEVIRRSLSIVPILRQQESSPWLAEVEVAAAA